MSIEGELGDVRVADVLQFIHLGGRTGTLVVESDSEGHGEIGFYRGHVVSALLPGTQRLGDILVEAHALDPAALDLALIEQAGSEPRAPLGRVLVQLGAISEAVLYRALAQHLQRAVQRIAQISRGTFRFRPEDVQLVDGLSMPPADLLPHLELNTQLLVLEALRVADERSRRPEGGLPGPEAIDALDAAPRLVVSEAVRPRVHVVSRDKKLADLLRPALTPLQVASVELREAGAPPPGEPAPLVVVDARGDAVGQVAAIKRARPRAQIIAVIDGSRSLATVYDAGARAAVVADPQVIAACARSALRDRPTEEKGDRDVREAFGRLRRVLAELRSGLVSATVSLQLMSVISESVERAVFFLARKNGLLALGAFGDGRDGQPLAQAAQSMTVPWPEAGMLGESLYDPTPRATSFAEARLPPALTELLGPPASGQALVFPVMGRERVVAVIYADNGHHNRAIDQVDVLELAAAQVGLAFENELLLRRQPGSG